MACFHPLKCYKSIHGGITFFPAEGIYPMAVPCGQCIGCRLQRSKDWAVRCMHEASFHSDNCFITLTYDEEHLPYHKGLVKRDFQLFMKRFRKYISPHKVRFKHVGEYGAKFKRPHYHALLFGYDFPDKVIFRRSKAGILYTSDILSKLWGKGFVTIGELTYETAAYVARYCVKKLNGLLADAHYLSIDEDTGECFQIIPEYSTQSNRPGIGHDWIAKNHLEVYPSDFLIVKGQKLRPPPYYDKYFEHELPEAMEILKDDRRKRFKEMKLHLDSTPERLAVRETCAKARLRQKKRPYEDGD